MFTEAELIDAINELEGGRHSIQNCERLAAVYTVLDHLDADLNHISRAGYSNDSGLIRTSGGSEFLNIVNGKSIDDVLSLVDELTEAVDVLNPRLYTNFITKLREL